MAVPKHKHYPGPIRHTILPTKGERIYAGEKMQFSHEYDSEGRSKTNRKFKYQQCVIEREGVIGSHGAIDFIHEKESTAQETINDIIKQMELVYGKNAENSELVTKIKKCKSCIYVASVESALKKHGVAEAILKRIERIAESRGADFIVFSTSNKTLANIAYKLDYDEVVDAADVWKFVKFIRKKIKT